MGLDKRRAAIKEREYRKKEGSLMLATKCDQTGKMVGSADCESNCNYFHSANHENNAIKCFDPERDLF